MNKNSNIYIIIYTTVMIAVVAAALAFTSMSLQGVQAENVRIEKMGDILHSIGQGEESETTSDKAKYITEEYAKYITGSYAVNTAGEKVEGVDAFRLLIALKDEYDKPEAERKLPVFQGVNKEGKMCYIIPVWGAGLWGPIWGYVALADDWNTVLGVVFDHKGETPGLGAEMALPHFQNQFKGKNILKEGQVVGIVVQKGGAAPDDLYAVDALSGGTLTSNGIQNMLKNCLGDYDTFIKKQLEGKKTPAPATVDTVAVTPADSSTINTKINE